MASAKPTGKPLVIVESPAKARTIARFLGDAYAIEASIGHVRDLPASADQIPAEVKKEKWARLGIDVENDFKPLYVVPQDKQAQIRKLKKLVREAPILYLATDEDREGESISWHLVQVLEPKGEVRRLVFHEITKEAIQSALANPRDIDADLVEAQETRRLVDRLFGYEVSPLLWKKIKPRLSAGRVQSVAVRLVVERERERIRFRTAEFWDLVGAFEPTAGASFEATLVSVGGRRVATGKDFDAATGKLAEGSADRLHLDEAAARALAERLSAGAGAVESVEQKPYTERPQPPFTTSTLQQEAGRKLGFAAKRTMRAAQRLYESGYITYMRTDSTELSSEALQAARSLIADTYGAQHLPDAPRTYRTKVRNAQEAHEAIRPAGSSFTLPERLGADMGADERRLYELIWKRTVACQMKDAKGHRTTLVVALDDARFQASGRTIDYPGFRLAYVARGEEAGGEAETDRILPAVARGDALSTRELRAEGHSTRPPARLTEASLVAELEARGIGRPSTYASIIDTIQQRDYCFKRGSALVPTLTAFAVTQLLNGPQLDWLVDYAFTARMEDDLDEISNGRKEGLDYLRGFYIGNGQPGLREHLKVAEQEIDARTVCTIGDFDLGEFDGHRTEVRVGRYGPFLACGEVSATLPEDLAPDELDAAKANELLAQAAAGPRSLGSDPASGLTVLVKNGRFGPYFQLGTPEEVGAKKRPKMVSLLPRMSPETATLADALSMLALPRDLGELTLPEGEPGAGETHPVLAQLGRYGPFLKCGAATRSIPAEDDVLEIDLERARELYAQPKQGGRRGRAQAAVLKELGAHPTSGAALRLLEGRYGPYVTDGETNASLPKGSDPAALTLEAAVELIDARAASGTKRKKTGARKKATSKKATAKKTASKKTASKKTASKKTGAKKAAPKKKAASKPSE